MCKCQIVSHSGPYDPCLDSLDRYAVAHENSIHEIIKVSSSLRSCPYHIYVDFRTMDVTITTFHPKRYESPIVNLH